jgi:CRP/FNR family transcriptional regulator
MTASDRFVVTVCTDCASAPRHVWENMPPDFMLALAGRKTVRKLGRGDYLFHQGDACGAVFRLLSGVLLLRKGDRDGHSVVIRMMRPGSTLGYRALVRGEPHTVSAHCVTDVVVCHIPAQAARWAFEQNRALEREFAADMVRNIDCVEDQALQMLTLCVRDRVLVLLHQMAGHFGRRDGDGMYIKTPVSKSDMAAMLGIARESMSRSIRRIENEGLLEFHPDGVSVPSVDRFDESVAAILGPVGTAAQTSCSFRTPS